MQTRAVVEFGELDLNRAIRFYGPIGDLAVYKGKYYPSKAPLMSFAAIPVYAALRALMGGTPRSVSDLTLVYFSRLALTAAPTLLILIWIRRFLRSYVTPMVADVITAMYALGSLAFSYSLLFMSHQPSAVLVFSAFYVVWSWSRSQSPDDRLLLFVGLLGSAAVATEYTTAIAVLGISLYVYLVLRARGSDLRAVIRAVALFIAGALPLTALLLAYHSACFGAPLASGYQHLADQAYQDWHRGGFLGIGLPQPHAFFLSYFSLLRGLFSLAPGLLLAIPGVYLLFTRARADSSTAPLAWTTLSIVVGYTYFTSAFSYESWGWTTGPRHLTSLVPFLLLPCALALSAARRWWRALSAALIVESVLITSALTFVNYIPSDVSNALVALAIPLTASGDLVPSVLCGLGLVNPAAGIVIWACVLAVAVWLLLLLLPRTGRTGLLAFVCCVSFSCICQVLSYRNSDADRAALTLLTRVWLAPPGRAISLFRAGP